MRPRPVIAALAIAIAAAGCSRSRPVRPQPVPSARVGECVDPSRGGVVSRRPDLQRADRDLDGDRRPEVVVADRRMCTDDGNCYWNLYAADASARCQRYVGTVAASVIDRLRRRGDDGFHDLRGWWQLSSGSRVLLQEYRYRHGGYRVTEAMVCRQGGDDQLQCAADGGNVDTTEVP